MWGTAQDYIRFCQMLLSGGLSPDGARVLKASTVRSLWRDSLVPFADGKGHVEGWHVDETEGPPWEGGSWETCGFSSASSMLTNLRGSLRGGAPARHGTAMGLGGVAAPIGTWMRPGSWRR